MSNSFLLYGSYGYTGNLIAEHAVAQGLRPLLADGELLAIASNVPLTATVPVFDLNDAAGLAEFIEGRLVEGRKSKVEG